jgi:EAL domain-containing protein (putative c-di-GMP-specific phosphodiesterase class I)
MVATITELAHFMKKKVIAEFAEDEAICQVLRDIGVDYAQGYHFGKPKLFTEQLDEVVSRNMKKRQVN